MQRKNGVKTCLDRAPSNSLGPGSANFGQYSAIFSKCAECHLTALLPSKCTESLEIPRDFDLIAVQGHPRSSILVSMESPYVTSY